jgi:ketosteroid isomerase-like protein
MVRDPRAEPYRCWEAGVTAPRVRKCFPVGGGDVTKRMALLVLAVCLAIPGFAQTSHAQKGKKAPVAAGAVDKAYLQKIWDGWATLDPAAVRQYYAQGPHVFFDIAPLKYASWDEYQAGVTEVLADYKSAKCRVNDDAQIHKSGGAVWITATVAYEMTHKAGKVDMGNFRWTAVFEKQDGKWLIVHEHVSEPLP